MKDGNGQRFIFPVGYLSLHKDRLFNYQLNRWYSLGYALLEDLKAAASKINTFDDWKREMISQAEKAASVNRFINAAFYYRAAEFFTLPDDPDKAVLYDRFIDLFYKAFADDAIERVAIPYNDVFLPAIKISGAKDNKKGTIIIHGGFDSFIEEFYSWMRYFADRGYDVIGFEGPGQGAAHRKYGLPLDYRWEIPARTLLDYFRFEDVTWIGISMGGWFCFRAAAFEPRIKRVIASGVGFDYGKFPNCAARLLMNLFFTHFKDFTNAMTVKKMKKDTMHAWSIGQLMYIADKKTPVDAAGVAFQLNEKNLHSELVKQDVLILTGRNDHFIPFKMHRRQLKALTAAKSVTGRIFTREEQSQNHCQIGNVGLALDVMEKWIQAKTSPDCDPQND